MSRKQLSKMLTLFSAACLCGRVVFFRGCGVCIYCTLHLITCVIYLFELDSVSYRRLVGVVFECTLQPAAPRLFSLHARTVMPVRIGRRANLVPFAQSYSDDCTHWVTCQHVSFQLRNSGICVSSVSREHGHVLTGDRKCVAARMRK